MSGSQHHATVSLLIGRHYTTPPSQPSATPHAHNHNHIAHHAGVAGKTHHKKSTAVPKLQPLPGTPNPPIKHEVHEGTAALNMAYNPPGGGPAGVPGGGGGFTFTNSPVLDAIITTAIGLGAGMCLTFERMCAFISHITPSIRRRYHLCKMVQEERPGQG